MKKHLYHVCYFSVQQILVGSLHS